MPRQSTLPPKWLRLVEALGGFTAAHHAIGIARMSLWRTAHGRTPPGPELRRKVAALARLHNLTNPLEPDAKVTRRGDLRALELMGDGLAKGMPPPPMSLDFIKAQWSEDALLELAEKDNTDTNVLRAVTFLLEPDDRPSPSSLVRAPKKGRA